MNNQLGPRDDVVSGPCPLHILPGGLDADAEDPGCFPVGLPGREQAQTLDFPAAEVRPFLEPRKTQDPSGGPERVRSNQLRAQQPAERPN